MHTNIVIRDATPGDRVPIRDLVLAAFAEYESLMPHWRMYQQYLMETLEHADVASRIVATRDGKVVGHVLLYPTEAQVYATTSANGDWPEIRVLAVSPLARGQGVGTALLDECIRRAREAGATCLGLHTEDLMVVARRMYRHKGFAQFPELDFSPSPGVIVKGYRMCLTDAGAGRMGREKAHRIEDIGTTVYNYPRATSAHNELSARAQIAARCSDHPHRGKLHENY